jgi:hypothetical protein
VPSTRSPTWSGKAIASSLLALPAWLIAFVGGCLILPSQFSPKSAGDWRQSIVVIVLCFLPALFISRLGFRALRDPSVGDGSKRGAWSAAFGMATLPTVLVQTALYLLAETLPGNARVLGLFAFPAGFAMGLWLAVRAHRNATGRSAAPWPGRFARTFAVVYAVALLPLVPIVMSPSAPRAPRPPKSAPTVTKPMPPLSQGAIELVGISRHPSINQPWWRADGSPAPDGGFVSPEGIQVYPGREEHAFEFVARTRDLPPGSSSLAWKFHPNATWVGGGDPSRTNESNQALLDHELVAAIFPRRVTSVRIDVGVAPGAWKTLATSKPSTDLSTSAAPDSGTKWNVSFSEAVETDNREVVVHLTHTQRPDWETRLIAVSTAREEITSSRSSMAADQATASFKDLTLAEVKEIRFQGRQYEWVEFRDVALQPKRVARSR